MLKSEVFSRRHEAVIGYRLVANYGHRGWVFSLQEEHYSRELIDQGDAYAYVGRGHGQRYPKHAGLLRPGVTDFQVVLGVPVSARRRSVQSRKDLFYELLEVLLREADQGQQDGQWQSLRGLRQPNAPAIQVKMVEKWGCTKGAMAHGNSVIKREVFCF